MVPGYEKVKARDSCGRKLNLATAPMRHSAAASTERYQRC